MGKTKTKRTRNKEKNPEKAELWIRILFYSLGSIFYLLVILNMLDLLVPGLDIFPWF